MDDIQFHIISLFSSPLGVVQVKEDCSYLKKIITDYEFIETNTNDLTSKGCFATTSLNVLDSFPREKNIIENYFNFYKNKFLKLESQQFQLTTSWGTKCLPGGYSQFHNHKNSLFSGIFYYDEVDGGDLQFESYGIFPQQIVLNNPSEWNMLNSRSWIIQPQKNKLIFFPSYLYHKITENNSENIRYSIAFNFFPIGSFGVGDSSINIHL